MKEYDNHNLKLCSVCNKGFYVCDCNSRKDFTLADVMPNEKGKYASNGQLLKAVAVKEKPIQPK